MDNMKEKLKNTKKNSKNKKIIILLAIILILSIIVNILSNKPKDENVSSKYESIRQIIEKYESTYIKEKKSEDETYFIDIYVSFKYDTFEDGKSNQRFYENIIGDLAEYINESYRIFDEEKNIKIEVIKNQNSENTLFLYLINGNNNYFSVEQSKKLLNDKKVEKNTNLQINSDILKDLLENEWKSGKVNFGTKDSSFDGYDIYFDEGIEVRTISNKIYNIVFTSKYNKSVINGIIPETSLEQIAAKLGEPTYGSKEGKYVGYKNEDIYVFFIDDTISIYRNETTDMTEFEELLEKYISKQIETKEFMNELTYLWDDYEEYTYNENRIYINYPQKGLKIDMDKDSSLGIQIFNNCNITDKISNYINNGKITGCLEYNLTDRTFLNKVVKFDEYKYIATLGENEDTKLISSIYYSIVQNNKILFISKTKDNMNNELKEKISQGFFINDYIYIYSIEKEGIFSYNVLTNKKDTLLEGTEKYELINYENEILKYDDKEIKINME